nr:hypothetical protein [uncultured Draconibacterium sp.]
MIESFFCNFDWNSFWNNVIVSLIFLTLSIVISIKLIPFYTLKLLRKKRKPFITSKISILLLELCEFFEKNTFKTKEICEENLFIYSINKRTDKNLIGLIAYNITDKKVAKKIDNLIVKSVNRNDIENSLKKLENEFKIIIQLKIKLESFLNIHTLDIDTEYLFLISDLCTKIRAFEIKFNRNYNSKDLFDNGLMKRYDIDGISELRASYKLIIDLTIFLLGNENIEYHIEKE